MLERPWRGGRPRDPKARAAVRLTGAVDVGLHDVGTVYLFPLADVTNFVLSPLLSRLSTRFGRLQTQGVHQSQQPHTPAACNLSERNFQFQLIE